MKYYLFSALVLLTFALTGCGRSHLFRQQMGPFPSEPVCRVAVLPFLSESDFPQAAVIAQKVFAAELQAAGGQPVVQEGDVLKVYQQLRIIAGLTAPSQDAMQLLASRLDAQLLITGKVIEMGENRGEHGSINPVLSLEIDVLNPYGTVLWRAFQRRQGGDFRKAMHFGTIHTVTGLSQQVSREIIDLWLREGPSRCDIGPKL